MQIVRVEAIAQVRRDRERLEGARLPQPPGDCTVAVDLLPRALVTGGELLRAHVQRLEHDVLTVVELPVARQDAVLLGQTKVERRAGKRRQHRKARQVDAGVDRKLDRGVEDLRRVVVQTEHEAALDCDPEVVQVSDDLRVVNGVVELLPSVLQAAARKRLESEQKPAATRPGHELHQIRIVGDRARWTGRTSAR